MNRKVLFRCSLISLLLAVPTPLLIALFVSLTGSALAGALQEALALEGVARVYLVAALVVFVVLLAATLAVHAVTPQLATLAEVENDDREIGEVKWFNVNKGYGFITRDSGEDVFVHFRAIRGKGHRTLAEGQKVRYHVVHNERGLQADDVTVITFDKPLEHLDDNAVMQHQDLLLATARDASPPRVLFDLSNVLFFGSTFIELVFRVWHRLNSETDSHFALCGVSDYCLEVLQVTHLDQLWPIHTTRSAAIAQMAGG